VAIAGLVALSTPAQAQLSKDGLRRLPASAEVATAIRAIPSAPSIDGMLDDEAWLSAPVISDFIQRDPDEGEPATERTEAKILYTDNALFVGIRAFDSRASEIKANLTRRDEWSPSDWISIMIDSYYDRRTAFEFSVNPAGVKLDIYRYDDNDEDRGWDAVWDVATSLDAEGWTAEFRIPWSQLRFGNGHEQRFGFNIYRRINRLNEEQYWKLLPKNESGFVSKFGDLIGIEGIEPPRRVEIMPYISSTSAFEPAESGNPFRTGSDQNAAIGADINVGVTSNLTLNATINPDFGQVEADPAVVNLSAFETFFPEKRPFFNEGIDVFKFSIGGREQLFYTRRIGRAPQGSADDRGGYAQTIDHSTILGAAKLSGKTSGGWTLGFLGALTAEEKASAVDSVGVQHRDAVEPRTSYFVGRLAKDFRDGFTQVGLFGAATNRSIPENLQDLRSAAYTGGINWSHRFKDDAYAIEGYVVGSHVRGSAEAIEDTQRSSARYFQRPDADHVSLDPTRTSLSGFGGNVEVAKKKGNWRGSAAFETRSPGLELNDLGFQRTADRHFQYVWLQRRWLEPGTVFRRFYVNVNQYSAWTYGGERRFMGGNLNGNYTLANYWGGWWGLERSFSSLAVGGTRGGPAITSPGGWNGWGGIETDDRKDIRGSVGGWFFIQDENDSWGNGIHANISIRPTSNVDFSIGPDLFRQFDSWQYLQTDEILGTEHYTFGELSQTTLSMTFRGNVTFTPDLSLQLYAEPFVSTGDYVGYKEVTNSGAARFDDQFDVFGLDRIIDDQGEIFIDLDRDGSGDIELGNPDFTFLSFRSNVVLRWEYKLGSTIFFVWQHNRSDDNHNNRFRAGKSFGEIFEAPAENRLVVKINYWLSL
jgi:hypothetical protein